MTEQHETPNPAPRRRQPWRFTQPWRLEEGEIGIDAHQVVTAIFIAAGIEVFCDDDPLGNDVMRAAVRRLKAMTGRKPVPPPTDNDRLRAVELIEEVAKELRDLLANKRPIDYRRAYQASQERLEHVENFYKNND